MSFSGHIQTLQKEETEQLQYLYLFNKTGNFWSTYVALNRKKHKAYISRGNVFKSATAARKRARALGLKGIHAHGRGAEKRYMPGSSHQAYLNKIRKRK